MIASGLSYGQVISGNGLRRCVYDRRERRRSAHEQPLGTKDVGLARSETIVRGKRKRRREREREGRIRSLDSEDERKAEKRAPEGEKRHI